MAWHENSPKSNLSVCQVSEINCVHRSVSPAFPHPRPKFLMLIKGKSCHFFSWGLTDKSHQCFGFSVKPAASSTFHLVLFQASSPRHVTEQKIQSYKRAKQWSRDTVIARTSIPSAIRSASDSKSWSFFMCRIQTHPQSFTEIVSNSCEG